MLLLSEQKICREVWSSIYNLNQRVWMVEEKNPTVTPKG